MQLRKLIVLLLLPGALLTACGSDSNSPNVILIVMDTTSGERCSVNGYARNTTPHLEKIARGGLNFRNTWSPSGWTGPAHASLFTGLRLEHHGFYHGNLSYLRKEFTTLAERLREAGYRTGCFTNSMFISPEFGLRQGFEHYVPLFAVGNLGYPTASPTHSLALDWVREVSKSGTPFFLFINNMEAHFEYTPPQEFVDQFAEGHSSEKDMAAVSELTQQDLFKHNIGMVKIPPGIQDLLSDLYDGEIACLDQEIGRLIAKLKAEGLLENTLLVITADHGENLGRHGLLDHMFSLHRTLLHVPLVIRLPDGTRAGEIRNEVVRLEDLFPTILEVCGLPVPEGLDSESLLGDLGVRHARAMRGCPEEYMTTMEINLGGSYGFEPFICSIQSEFDGRHHRIEYSDGRRLVFDVIEDPAEFHPFEE